MARASILMVLMVLMACGATEEAPAASGRAPSAATASAQAGDAPDLMTPEQLASRHGTFDGYWYRGKAELTRYELSQSRYGETHQGEAVLMFVTEDFLTETQIKKEAESDEPAESALKLIAYRRFYTGIYPYTVSTSTYLPARGDGAAWKLSGSVQEWCGSTYTQLNRRDGALAGVLHSYFQAEGDQELTLPDVVLEDALFSRIRRNPESLPTGELELIVASHALRFAHRPMQAEPASAELGRAGEGPFEGKRMYTLRYARFPRVLRIYFEEAFPHVIAGWEEEGDGPLTRATRSHAIVDDYWSHNGADDDAYRRALGLGR